MLVTLHVAFFLTFRRLLILWIIASCWVNYVIMYYEIPGLSNKWFESYLADFKQFVLINGYASSISSIVCGVTQSSFLGVLTISTLHE